MLIFSPHKKKYIWYLPKKVNFLFFILYSKENYRKHNVDCFGFRIKFVSFNVFIGYKNRSLHLESDLE